MFSTPKSDCMTKTYRGVAKASPRDLTDSDGKPEAQLDPKERKSRDEFVAYISQLGWTQLHCSLELGVSRSTVECWVSPKAKKHTTIPGWAKDLVRRLAQERTGCDSTGRIRASTPVAATG